MRPQTEYFAIKSFIGDADRLRALRDQLQARNPDRIVTLAETFRACVSSGTAVLLGQPVPGLQPTQDRPPRDG